MLLFWRIRYFDTGDKEFKDRDLLLETDSLDLVTKAAVEASYALKDSGHRREMLRYRCLFREKNATELGTEALWARPGGLHSMFIHDYFEDEVGRELSRKDLAMALTGRQDAVLLPPGAKQHDVQYMLANHRPISIDQIALSQEQLNILGYFARDLRELLASSFLKEGPGALSAQMPTGNWNLRTAVSDEEIRSFVTIFRRLYMENEPANFVKAADVFVGVLAGYPLADWIRGTAAEYASDLGTPPDGFLPSGQKRLSFTRKLLMDVFLYTQYAHQPDERRTRQFRQCLASVGDNRALLTWLFLTEMWKSALHVTNAGAVMADFYDRYCDCRNVKRTVLPSVKTDHPGLGILEKKDAQEARVLREKAEELAIALWKHAGSPEGGHAAFIKDAIRQLMSATGRLEVS